MFKRKIKQFNVDNIKPRNGTYPARPTLDFCENSFSIFRSAVIVFFVLTILTLPDVYAQPIKSILVFASYHRTFPGTKLIVRAIETEFEESDVNLEIEYMDTKQYRDQAHLDNLFYLYKNKSRQTKYDVIIAIDNNALLFLLMHRDQLWPDVPIVFCGVDRYHASLCDDKPADTTIQDVLQGNKLVTGVTEGFDYPATVETASKIHPYVKHIFLINDGVNPVPYFPNLSQYGIQQLTDKFEGRFEFVPFLLTKQNTDELISITKQHEEDGLLLFVNNYIDEKGDFALKDEIFSQFWQNCSLPIYVVSTSLLETGYPVGGYISSYKQGKIAVDMAIRIINGENPDDIPIADMAFSYFFNYHQLKKFGIPFSALPPGSTVLDQPQSFYYKYKGRIWAVIIVVSSLSFLVIALFANIIRRIRVEKALKESEYKYRALFEMSADGIIIADAETRNFLYANAAVCGMFGYTENEMIALSIDQIHPQESLDYVKKQFALQAKGIIKLAQDMPCLRKDGSVFYSDVNAASAASIEGKKCVIGFFRDITERKNAEEELKNASERLEQRVQQRTEELAKAVSELKNEIAERNKAEQKLLEYQKQLRSLATELSLAEERLRRKIAVDVHDGLGQSLAISKIKIESLARMTSSEKIKHVLSEVSEIIGKTIQSARTMTFELSPPVLYELGLEAAIEWLVRQTKERDGLAAVFEDDKKLKPVADNVKIILFQAVRELLINAVKHAKANKVKVEIQKIDSIIRIRIKDDGVGFDVTKADFYDFQTSGFGLFNIKERLGQIEGKIDIDSVTGKGTVVTIEVPIDHKKEKLKMEP